MKTANSKILMMGEIDKTSVKLSFAKIPVKYLKEVAQSLREKCDWYGRNSHENYGVFYDCCMEVIHISEPHFETTFIEAV